MAIEVLLPRLGWDSKEGSLVEWVKHDGDAVQPGDVICLIEGDKAVTEVETLDRGVLRIPADSPPIGQKVAVGTRIAYILAPGEALPVAASQPTASVNSEQPAASQPARLAPQSPQPTGAQLVRASPRARRLARELGLDWSRLQPTGAGGRVRANDVLAAAVQPVAAGRRADAVRPIDVAERTNSATSLDATASLSPAGGDRRPLAGARRVIAERLAASARATAAVTLTTEADATELARFRERLKHDLGDGAGSMPTYNDLLIRLTAVALTDHPALNSRLEGDDIVTPDHCNVGLAVDTERGLLVVVVPAAETKSIQRIADETATLVAAARNGVLNHAAAATFTITNLGMYEIDAFTPIINLPECAILGVGRITPKPVVIDPATEQVGVRQMVTLSLTFDHRLVDGAPAARFLQRIKQFIERPTRWLVR